MISINPPKYVVNLVALLEAPIARLPVPLQAASAKAAAEAAADAAAQDPGLGSVPGTGL